MSEELIEVVRYLSAEGYVVKTPQNYYIFTNKFYNDFTNKDVGIVPSKDVVIAKSLTTHIGVPIKVTTDSSRDAYLEFIAACNIPMRIVNPKGESYAANQYSEKGRKAFAKILIRSDVIIDLLVKSTQLYYKSSVGYKLKIGNYIADGAWETHYKELVDSLSSGTVDEHIKQELKDDNTGISRYQTGSGPIKSKGVSLQLQKASS